MIPLAKVLNEFYPDLIRAGGLEAAITDELARRGVELSVTGSPFPGGPVYARVSLDARQVLVYIAQDERRFLAGYWKSGVSLADAATDELPALVESITHWLTDEPSLAEFQARFPIVHASAKGKAYERGEATEYQWQQLLTDQRSWGPYPVREFLEVASTRPELRQLYPVTSLITVCFSRCTGYPFTRDTPTARPLPDGRWEVRDASGRVLGQGDVDAAVEWCVRALPPGCGPAVPGTADDVPPLPGCSGPRSE